jgi:hypothetical protein
VNDRAPYTFPLTSIPEPTAAQCDANEIVELPGSDGPRRFLATWYPQMGGYVGKCMVSLNYENQGEHLPCFDAYVWHDGEFAFSDGPPFELHHCDAEQFIRFGEVVRAAQASPLAISSAKRKAQDALAEAIREMREAGGDPTPQQWDRLDALLEATKCP